jgi:DNA-binding NarL/FixJ family response regulator
MDGSETLLDPLHRRETVILRLLAEGLSNHGIAQKRFIAQGTVSGTSNKFKLSSITNRIIFGLTFPVWHRSQVVSMERVEKV